MHCGEPAQSQHVSMMLTNCACKVHVKCLYDLGDSGADLELDCDCGMPIHPNDLTNVKRQMDTSLLGWLYNQSNKGTLTMAYCRREGCYNTEPQFVAHDADLIECFACNS